MPTATLTIEYNSGSGWTAVPSQYVKGASPAIALCGGENVAGFGDQAEARCTITLFHAAFAAIPDRLPIRATFGVDATTTRVFQFRGGQNVCSGSKNRIRMQNRPGHLVQVTEQIGFRFGFLMPSNDLVQSICPPLKAVGQGQGWQAGRWGRADEGVRAPGAH